MEKISGRQENQAISAIWRFRPMESSSWLAAPETKNLY
jgi:hypothetical protein